MYGKQEKKDSHLVRCGKNLYGMDGGSVCVWFVYYSLSFDLESRGRESKVQQTIDHCATTERTKAVKPVFVCNA